MVPTPRSTPRALGAVGVGLALLFALWTAFVAGAGAGRPAPVVWLMVAFVIAASTVRVLAMQGFAVLKVVAVAITGSLFLTWPGVLQPAGAPTGYANANATLASLGAVAAVGAAHRAGSHARRRWAVLAVVLAACAALTGSVAGVLVLCVGGVLLATTARTRRPGFAIVGGMVAVCLTLGVTTVIALDGADGLAGRDVVRADLWAGAVDLLREAPARGIGPGEFAAQNPVTDDDDLRWAHHGYLQVAAELGLGGLVLVLALAGWVWVWLWRASSRRPAAASVAATAATIVGLHGAVDYVWHTPEILVILVVLVVEAGVSADAPEVDGRARPDDSWAVPPPGR